MSAVAVPEHRVSNLTPDKDAVVVAWNDITTWIECPYGCDTVGSRKFQITDLKEDAKLFGTCKVCATMYRVVYPFYSHSAVRDMWWEVDRGHSRWRTVAGRSLPVLEPPQVSRDSAIEQANSFLDPDQIAEQLGNLALSGNDEVVEITKFRDFCLSNSIQEAEKILTLSENQSRYVNQVIADSGKPLINLVVAEGHGKILDLLLRSGIDLSSRDKENRTALLTAIALHSWILVEKLIEAGADIHHFPYKWQHLPNLETKRGALVRAQENQVEKTVIVKNFRAARRIWERRKDIEALEDFERQSKILVEELQGRERSETLMQSTIERIAAQQPDRYTGCLVRGTNLPWTLAMSGFGLQRLDLDCVLNQAEWMDRAFNLAAAMGKVILSIEHELGRPGSYYACHVEVQLLTFFVWSHILRQGKSGEVWPRRMENSRPSRKQIAGRLLARIMIHRPYEDPRNSGPTVCQQCQNFCQGTAEHFGFRIQMDGLKDGKVIKLCKFPRSRKPIIIEGP